MKPTQPLLKRLRIHRRIQLSTKQVNGGYYKGTRTGSMGWHTKHGGYIIDPAKVRTYVVPAALPEFRLTPFVTKRMEPLKGAFEHGLGPLSGQLYLKRWEDAGRPV